MVGGSLWYRGGGGDLSPQPKDGLGRPSDSH